ncbi:MAG: hypothetical protein D8M58_13850 [Calditrichaeota bacterium]|nr:MAG: hypothetical protein DWQ03_15090 [Calditrichota bacterium]MBL1206483.1 hypothetical protein [Calditrichota bacterium]NOG46310.1 hypothetical protein [Calditrichota bacterium]
MKYTIYLLSLVLFSSCQSINSESKLSFSNNLVGHWKAAAFSGELHEKWKVTKDGWILQEGHYIENNDTTYSAKTKIEKIGKDLILFSVIKNSNPKIFKATLDNADSIIFENSDYKNPHKVKYEFLGNSNYRRTITGVEEGSLVTYQFDFERIN